MTETSYHMKKTSYEKFRGDRYESQRYSSVAQVEEHLAEIDAMRAGFQEKFPYAQAVEGYWPAYDVATRWCWQQFGPCDGRCYESSSEYPACPLILATKYVLERPSNVSEEDWEKELNIGYRIPGDHSHEGTWTCVHWTKTGYDYGVGEYRFIKETVRDAFASVVESLGMGEHYDFKKDED